MAVGFFGPADPTNPNKTMDELARRQAFAELLTKGAAAAQPKNWHQGLVSGLGYLLGGIERKKLDKEQAGLQKEANVSLAKALMAGSPSASAMAGSFGGTPDTPVSVSGPSPSSPAGGARAAAGGLPGNYGDFVNRVVKIESGGNPNAESTTSSAAGAGQFINSTWLNTVKKHRPDLASGRSDSQILDLRKDPNLSREMIAAYAQDNAAFLQSRGLGTGPTEVYAAHNLGPAGAAKVLSASPDTTLASLLGPEAMRANPHMRNMTARTYLQSIAGKVGGGGGVAPSAGGGVAPTAAAAPAGGLSPTLVQAVADMANSGNPYQRQAAQPLIAAILQRQMTPTEFGYATVNNQLWRTDPRGGPAVALTPPVAGKGTSTDDIAEYQFAQQNGYTGSFTDFLTMKGGKSGDQSTNDMKEYALAQQQGFKGTFQDYQTEKMRNTVSPDQRVVTGSGKVVAEGPAKPLEQVKLSDITAMRKEAQGLPNVSRYAQAAPIYNSLTKSLNKEDRASDLDFVYGMAQIFDPNSVVREGEQYIVQSLAGLPGLVQGWVSYVAKGGKIPKETRKELLDALGTRILSYRAAADEELKPLRGVASQRGINPAEIIPGFIPMTGIEPPPQAGQPARQPSPDSVVRVPEGMPAPPGTERKPQPPPPAAIDLLRSDPSPEAKQEFDQLFGPGAADAILSQPPPAPPPQPDPDQVMPIY